ncbi:hypothetical protein [Clostridium frigidicarnis]|uniref:Uncharacterized protein n=1 Tax=Clostridium frigidicarnis TaxID=84698 RepID=A0A1I0YED6_9CLOT|nr:hypothetical protein [Clostridium frigidicarnis]SFB11146.1 hypothetical protein SAMN04488528_101296 [Clostridium frigidicarnis]
MKNEKDLNPNKKWCQLNKKEQIIVSTMLRDLYIRFVVENNRKPNRDEKQFIVATVYLKTEEEDIFIPANQINKYFQSKIPNYDKSIEKLGF